MVLDEGGDWWMIEANASPGFDYFIACEGAEPVVHLYQKIIEMLQSKG